MIKISKNTYEFDGDVCIGYTSNGEKFLIDADKYSLIKDISWSYNSCGYVCGNISIDGKQHRIKLHRLVTNCPEGMCVDHIHGSDTRYDNRSCNLRICTYAQNAQNVTCQKRNKYKAKGVSLAKCGTYQAQIQINGKLKYLGSFKTIKEAADAYDKAAKEHFGEFARLNNYKEEK